jgi:hypothetical protein
MTENYLPTEGLPLAGRVVNLCSFVASNLVYEAATKDGLSMAEVEALARRVQREVVVRGAEMIREEAAQ